MATSASRLLGVNRNTINAYYNTFREKILEPSLKEQKKELEKVELDESYFVVRGRIGCGTAGKTPVLGLLKRIDGLF